MNENIRKLKELIDESDAIVVGAGAGLSTAAGFEYGGKTFFNNFKCMHDRYGYTDMYSAGFHPFETSEEKWGYWSKFIYLNRYKDGAKSLYVSLLNILKDKNYFVLTTNVDHQFQLAGFDKNRLFYTQGDYGLFQCSHACHSKTYDNEEIIMDMIKEQKNGSIPSKLIPVCPVCGEEMETNLRKDSLFVEDEGWHKANERYISFLSSIKDKKVLFLELGVGWNTPGIIKYPFWEMVFKNKKATYVSINAHDAYAPKEILDRSMLINEDLSEVISSLNML